MANEAARCGTRLRLARWALLATAVVTAAGAGVPVAMAATAPAGYQLVTKQFSAPQSSFTTLASVACPAGTATWGGGNYLSAWSPPVPIVSTYWNGAAPGAWTVAEANTNPFTASFGVMAICAKKPLGYKLVATATTAAIAQIGGANALCPTGKVLLSGGLTSTSDRPTVHLAWRRRSAAMRRSRHSRPTTALWIRPSTSTRCARPNQPAMRACTRRSA